jgi:hypothetical protein
MEKNTRTKLVYNPAFAILVNIYRRFREDDEPFQNVANAFGIIDNPLPISDEDLVKWAEEQSMMWRTYRDIDARHVWRLWSLHMQLLEEWKKEQGVAEPLPEPFLRSINERVFDGPPLKLSDHQLMQTFQTWCHSRISTKHEVPIYERRCEAYLIESS